MTDDYGPCAQGPRRLFKVGCYQFAWAAGRGWRRWECSDGCKGVSMAATPVHAFVALKRWQKVPSTPWDPTGPPLVPGATDQPDERSE